jgi:predicted nucleic acid binding AN1-type Zn finger protein
MAVRSQSNMHELKKIFFFFFFFKKKKKKLKANSFYKVVKYLGLSSLLVTGWH